MITEVWTDPVRRIAIVIYPVGGDGGSTSSVSGKRGDGFSVGCGLFGCSVGGGRSNRRVCTVGVGETDSWVRTGGAANGVFLVRLVFAATVVILGEYLIYGLVPLSDAIYLTDFIWNGILVYSLLTPWAKTSSIHKSRRNSCDKRHMSNFCSNMKQHKEVST